MKVTRKIKLLSVEKSKEYPGWVCSDCGVKASKAMGNNPPSFEVSTFHNGVCGVCGETKAVTEPGDFFYPDFDIDKKKNS